MKKLFSLLPIVGLVIGIVAIATEISANVSFLSHKINNNLVVSTLSDTAYSGYLAVVHK